MSIQFWFEFASTYSYPTALRIEKLCLENNISLEWKPFLLGPIFQKQGWQDSPFNLYPTKGKYMWRDLERLCAHEGFAFQKPSQFPRNGLLAARIACAGQGEIWLPEFVRKVYDANFAKDQDVSSPAVLEKILQDLKIDAAQILQSALSDENKKKLRLQSEEAFRMGIFGAPSFITKGELFWGNDRLEDAISWEINKNNKK